MGFSAQTGRLALPALLLYAGCFFWTLGYDTIYAHQDKDDDGLIGVKSTARLFGARSSTWIEIFYAAALVCGVASVIVATSKLWTAFLMLPVGAHLLWQTRGLDIDDPQRCLEVFRSNRDAGILLAAAIIIASYFR